MKIGEFNELILDRFTSVGAYLHDEEENDVLLPKKYLSDDLMEGEKISVFVYRDSEDRIVATTEIPKIRLNGYAYLYIKDTTPVGAFADWGLEKDLLIPFKEQRIKLEEGRSYAICLLLDESTNRLYGTTKIEKHIESCEEELPVNTKVDLLILNQTDLGYKAVVNDRYSGLIYQNDISKTIKPGMEVEGFVSKVRDDGKLDVRLEESGYGKIDDASEKLLHVLKRQGHININDKSDPNDIREAIGMSKKTFKQAAGALYRQKLIRFTESGIDYLGH